MRATGLAVNESGAKDVRIYFNDELMVTAPRVSKRPDINDKYPFCEDERATWVRGDD